MDMRLLRSGALIAGFAYLLWRLIFTGTDAHPVLFVVLLVAEAYGLVRFAVDHAAIAAPRPTELPDPEQSSEPADVFVVVLDQPPSELRGALLSALALDQVASVTVVDVLDRHDIAETCERFEVPRVRGGDDGDLGDLLTEAFLATSAPYVVVQPADIVVLPDAVAAVVPAFDDPEIGVVVGRVDPVNSVSASDLGGYGELDHRDRVSGTAFDDAHALPWWNALSIGRREALAETGGFAPSRRGATLVTGLRLQVGGWRITEQPMVLGRRLAPASDHRRIHAWARDLHQRLELLRRTDVSWASTRITPSMRLAYMAPAVGALAGLQRLALLLVLLATAWGVGLPLVGAGVILVPLWATQMGLRLATRVSTTSALDALPLLVRDLLLAPTDLAVAWRAVRRRPLITELVDEAPGQRARFFIVPVTQALLVMSLLAALGGRVVGDGSLARFVVIGATVIGLVATVTAQLLVRRRQQRSEYRALLALPIEGSSPRMTAVAMTPFDLEITTSEPLETGTSYRLVLRLRCAGGDHRSVPVAASVRPTSGGRSRPSALLRFALGDDEQMDALIDYCAIVNGRQVLRGILDEESLSIEVVGADWTDAGDASVEPVESAITDEALP